MTRHRFLAALSIALLAASLVACGGGQAATVSPTQKPSVDAATILSSMATKISGTAATYQVHVTERLTLPVTTIEYDVNGSIAGPDARLEIQMTDGSQHTTASIVLKDGHRFASMNGGPWSPIGSTGISTIGNEWAYLAEPSNFVFDGIESDNTTLRFKNAKPIAYTEANTATLYFSETQMADVVVRVKPDGTPVSVDAKETGKASDGKGNSYTMTGTASYTFSNVGTPITIQAPY